MVLIAIGGAEDRSGSRDILKRVLDEAKGKDSRVLVITSATGYPEEVAETYKNAFSDLCVECKIAHITNKTEADEKQFLDQVENADVIFFSGGDQTRLTQVFADTQCLQKLRSLESSDKVIAGTSAGAAALSQLMIAGGKPEKADQKGAIKFSTGFGLIEKFTFDTHFLDRDRLPRLFNLVASHPDIIGVGLDEDTGLIIRRNGEMEVIGRQSVTFVDGSSLTNNNINSVAPNKKFHASGFKVTNLKDGQKFNY